MQDADKELFYSFNFENPVTRKPLNPWKWTIDRERDIFLITLGGQGSEQCEIPMFYVLVWKNNVITLKTFSDGQGDYTAGVEKWWKITRITIPESLVPEKDIAVELIKEALDAYGSAHKRDHVKKVEFKYISSHSKTKTYWQIMHLVIASWKALTCYRNVILRKLSNISSEGPRRPYIDFQKFYSRYFGYLS